MTSLINNLILCRNGDLREKDVDKTLSGKRGGSEHSTHLHPLEVRKLHVSMLWVAAWPSTEHLLDKWKKLNKANCLLSMPQPCHSLKDMEGNTRALPVISHGSRPSSSDYLI